MTPSEAEPYLGFKVATPTYLPSGSEVTQESLLRYTGTDPADPTHDIHMYAQYWVSDSAFGQVLSFGLKQRLATLPGDGAPCDQAESHQLGNGAIACASGGLTGSVGLTWVDNGVWYLLFSWEQSIISDEELLNQLELAIDAPAAAALQPIDDLTPLAWEVR